MTHACYVALSQLSLFFQKIKASLSLIPLFERNVFTYVYIIAITLWKFSNCKSNFRTKMVLLPQCDFQGVRKKKSIFLLSKMFAQKTLVLHYRKSSKKILNNRQWKFTCVSLQNASSAHFFVAPGKQKILDNLTRHIVFNSCHKFTLSRQQKLKLNFLEEFLTLCIWLTSMKHLSGKSLLPKRKAS